MRREEGEIVVRREEGGGKREDGEVRKKGEVRVRGKREKISGTMGKEM